MSEWKKPRRRRSRRRGKKDRHVADWCDLPDCDGLDCDGCACDLSLLLALPAAYRVVVGAFRVSAVDPYTRPRTPGARVASRLVRSYQVNISARRSAPVCNLTPSCSRYGLQALSQHGPVRAAILIRRRLTACRLAGQALREG